MTDKTLTLDKVNPLLLFGIHDVHLKRVEAAFPGTQFSTRGNVVKLRGPAPAVRMVERTFDELSSIALRSGMVTEADVDAVLSLVTTTPDTTKSGIGLVVLHTPTGGMIRTKTPGQSRLVQAATRSDIVFAVGPAGTGKTFLAVALAVAALKRKKVRRIILCRPAVEAGENLGFLPGDFREKIDPYLSPLYDALEELLGSERLSAHLESRAIEIVPLAFMRGRTLNSAYVILDEAQNATAMQMKMFLTRLGVASRAIVTGDTTQIDLASRTQSGLIEAEGILAGIDGIEFVYFSKNDVVRHRLVKDIIEAYDENSRSQRTRKLG